MDNVDVYPLLSGTHVIGDFSVGGSFYTNGLNYGRTTEHTPTAGAIHNFNYDLATHGSCVQINAINSNQQIVINLPSLNVSPYQNRTFLLTFDLILDNARINTTAVFAYQSPSVRLSTGARPAQEYTGELLYMPRSWRLDTPGGALSRRDYRGGPISFIVSTNSTYTWYRSISNDDDYIEDQGSINCIGAGGTGPYSLDVDNTIVNRTLYKFNEIIGAPNGQNITLNFNVLTDTDNKFTVYFSLPASNSDGNFGIKNNMASPHIVIIRSGGTCVTLTAGTSTVRDGQALLRCTYYHNRYGNNTHYWDVNVY